MAKATKLKGNIGNIIYSLMLPILFVVAWISALTGTPPGAAIGDTAAADYLRWLIYYSGFVLVVSAVMHSVFAKKTAASIGWKPNSFQYELAAFSLGAGIGCFYAVYHSVESLITIAIPISIFLFLAAVNHVREIIRDKNFAPNNTMILIWDFGMSISLAALIAKLI